MPTADQWFHWMYPFYADEADPRHVPYADVEWAMAAALPWKPGCAALNADQQNEAQAHYAASLLEYKASQAVVGGTAGGSSSTTTTVTTGPIERKRLREGDVETEYQYARGGSTSSVAVNTAARNANAGPSASYARWLAYWSVCNPTDIAVVGPPDGSTVEPVRRGGLITRRGWPD
jgi:hypothetical protein